MKWTLSVALLALLTIATTTSAFSQQQSIRGKIPFSFTVGEKVLPAGEYSIHPLDNHVLRIRSADGRNWANVVDSQSFDDAAGGSRLVFDRIGESYFLRRVHCPSRSALNVDVPIGRSEKMAREREAYLQTNQKVLVAMQ
jgi:hypothetical protein